MRRSRRVEKALDGAFPNMPPATRPARRRASGAGVIPSSPRVPLHRTIRLTYHVGMDQPSAIDHALLETARDAVLRLIPDAEIVYAFGSRAEGRARADSDLDLAVLGRAPLASLPRFELQRELSARLGLDVDFVDLQAANSVLRLEVVTRGQRLFCRDASRALDFEARVLGDYAALMDATRALRADIVLRGRVYAE